MRLIVLGSNGTYPTPTRPGSGYLVEQDQTRIWCDAGPGTFVALQQARGVEGVDAIILSHQHLDHCLDLLTAYHALAYGPQPRHHLPVFAPAAVWERITAFLDPRPDDPFLSTFDFRAVGDGDQAQIGGLVVQFAVTDHSVPTVATRFEGGGKSLAYSSDTGPAGDWFRAAARADLFLCEATYQGDGSQEVYPYHLTAFQAGAIGARQGVGQLVLTHLRPTADRERSRSEAETTFGQPVQVAQPGLTLEI